MLAVRLAVLFSTVISSATGCGLFFPHRTATPKVAEPTLVSVQVESHNWSDITIYLVTRGLPQRLGMVSALGEATFDFSSHRLNGSGDVRLRALPVAGQPFTSETILVVPGQAIFWTLESRLEASSVTVY
jgi:hypothetical protein